MSRIGFMLIMAFISTTSYCLDIGGITLPDTLETKDQNKLILNGAGIREKWFMDLYVGGLYLPSKQTNSEQIVAAKKPMAIRLHITSGMITSKKMTDATLEGFEKSTYGNPTPFEAEINELLGSFKEPIKNGDIFDFVYLPEEGISIFKNNHQVKLIACDEEFKEALFGIWLSDQPAQQSLKQDMLGKSS